LCGLMSVLINEDYYYYYYYYYIISPYGNCHTINQLDLFQRLVTIHRRSDRHDS